MNIIIGKRPERFCRCCPVFRQLQQVEGLAVNFVLMDVEAPTGVCLECAEDMAWDPMSLAHEGTDELPPQRVAAR